MAKGLLAEFYIDAVHLKAQSDKEGRPIFEDREFVKIIPIGDNKTVIVKEATDEIKQRFPEEYAVFKKGVEQTFTGTPLTQWPAALPAQIKMFNHFNVYTVDHLAELDDISISKIGPGTRDMVQKAKAYLAKASSTAEAQKFAVENERLREEVARLSDAVAGLKAQSDQNAGEPRKRGPGRPPKNAAEAAA